MPPRSNDYQKVIYYVQRHLAKDATVTESAMMTDPLTGTQREIDVLIEGSIAGVPISIAIEVRDQKRKGDITWIEQVRSKYDTLPIHQVILVSRSGFTKEAISKAQSWNIETLTPSQEVAPHGPLSQALNVSVTSIHFNPIEMRNGQIWVSDLNLPLRIGPKTALFTPEGRNIATIGQYTWNACLYYFKSEQDKEIESVTGDRELQLDMQRPLPQFVESTGQQFEPMIRTDPDNQLRRIERITVTWRTAIETRPMKLEQGQFRRSPFAFGKVAETNQLVIVHPTDTSDTAPSTHNESDSV